MNKNIICFYSGFAKERMKKTTQDVEQMLSHAILKINAWINRNKKYKKKRPPVGVSWKIRDLERIF